jgi:hypothetical protein
MNILGIQHLAIVYSDGKLISKEKNNLLKKLKHFYINYKKDNSVMKILADDTKINYKLYIHWINSEKCNIEKQNKKYNFYKIICIDDIILLNKLINNNEDVDHLLFIEIRNMFKIKTVYQLDYKNYFDKHCININKKQINLIYRRYQQYDSIEEVENTIKSKNYRDNKMIINLHDNGNIITSITLNDINKINELDLSRYYK